MKCHKHLHGFSPFELLYGRNVRGPLDVLRETWETNDRSSEESIISYVLSMREKLKDMADIVQKNLAKSQDKQKRWYDKNAKFREFSSGDPVMVLLPTTSNKLLAQWQGPYLISKRIGRVTYLVDMHDKKKRKRVLHVNMLKAFSVRKSNESSYWAEEVAEDADDKDILVWNDEHSGKPKYGEHLREGQQQVLNGVISDFADVFNTRPGWTTLAEHRIETGQAPPVRLPPYRLPHAYKDLVARELKEMEESGIIEPSTSEWASPIVLVKKKDGSLRMCVDYRRLNSVTQIDAYPMPRIDDLIDQLGKARFITTLDLTRGYWQMPVAAGDQYKTAFTTPYGLYQFKVMPFGLCGAPASFQRLMDKIVNGLDFAAAYLDDLVIFSQTWEEHIGHLHEIFQRLRSAGLTAKPGKCQFAMKRCIYLGHVVGNGRVEPQPLKIDAVQQFPVPETKKRELSLASLDTTGGLYQITLLLPLPCQTLPRSQFQTHCQQSTV